MSFEIREGYHHAINARVGYSMPSGFGPVPDDAIQWLSGMEADEFTLFDELDVVNPQPEVRDVNCLNFISNDSVVLGYALALDQAFSFEANVFVRSVPHTNTYLFRFASSLNTVIDQTNSQWYSAGTDSGNGSIAIGAWQHIVVTIDPAGIRNFYLDGALAGDPDQVGSVTALDTPELVIGDYNAGGLAGFDGLMQNVAIYDRVLTAEEVSNAANAACKLPSEEGVGFPLDSSGNDVKVTAMTAGWTTADGAKSANASKGHAPAVVSDGTTQHINLGFVADINTKFEVRARPNADGWLIGSNSPAYYALRINIGSTWSYSGLSSEPISTTDTYLDGSAHTYISEHGKLTIDGVEYTGSQTTPGVGTQPLFLFCRNKDGIPDGFSDSEVEHCKVWDNGVLVRDMVPLPGGSFLDLVNQEVYSNDGTGTLVTAYSPALEMSTSSNGSVTGTGPTQYIDLDFVPDEDTKVEIVGRFTNTSDTSCPIGSRTTNNVNDWMFYQSSTGMNWQFGEAMGGSLGIADTKLHTFTMDNTELTRDGESWPISYSIFTKGTYPHWLFALNSVGSVGSPAHFEMYSAKVWDNGTLVRDMTPLSGGRFLDVVNDVIYSNDGAGTLTTNLAYTPEQKTLSIGTFDGATDYAECVPLNYGTSDFDVSARVKFSEIQSANPSNIFSGKDDNDDGLRITKASGLGNTIYTSLNAVDINFPGPSDGEFHVYKLKRVGNTLETFLDDVSKGTADVTGQSVDVTTNSFWMAATASSSILGGEVSHIYASGLFEYDLTGYLGKTTTTLLDISGNGNDGTINSSDLDAFWGTRFGDAAGVIVDAKGYLPIANPGGLVYNRSETSSIQTGLGIVDSVVATLNGNEINVLTYNGISNTRAWYQLGNHNLSWQGGRWEYRVVGTLYAYNTTDSEHPQKTGWTPVAVSSIDVAYDSFYMDDESFKKWSYPELNVQYALNGYLNLWLRNDENGLTLEARQFPLGKVFTQIEAMSALEYFGTGGDVPYDEGGWPILDVNGYIAYESSGFDSGFDAGFGL